MLVEDKTEGSNNIRVHVDFINWRQNNICCQWRCL